LQHLAVTSLGKTTLSLKMLCSSLSSETVMLQMLVYTVGCSFTVLQCFYKLWFLRAVDFHQGLPVYFCSNLARRWQYKKKRRREEGDLNYRQTMPVHCACFGRLLSEISICRLGHSVLVSTRYRILSFCQ